MAGMFSIGEFSKITGLTIKSLRFYHEQGVLTPSHVEAGSGYRYYSESQIDPARVIAQLRDFEFTVAEVRDMVSEHNDDADILERLASQRSVIESRIKRDRDIARLLDRIITHETEATRTMKHSTYAVAEKDIAPCLIASIRMKGAYHECSKGFARIGRKLGRFIQGSPMLLHHDTEYKECDADFEACMPVKKGDSTDEITIKELPGGRALSLMHLGPYEELGRSYERIISHAKEHNLRYHTPTREIYHKGPGMIFKGNPKKYLTEIVFLIETDAS
ncbi:MerR family transcriptional regulator [Rhodopirellula sp. MGV]|uniref:MerR family transcriptional regulator n=1 Tax=Rhodopirellula sp. MGV TaxID=2023130 RepID=UPI000B961BB9|nr:MerR family transcriptional regulator [Rhodopirellula sp. MGV]OYP36061.1 MerR family transcriptional regulator [Rhodopirellula sp. MGV]PNY36580.1 MerR family DNA-binding transcriptional regulator [Rhodopirellula baltica]